MTEVVRPCCRAAVVAAAVLHAAAAVIAALAPTPTPAVLLATVPLLCGAWLAPGLLLAPFLRPRADGAERLVLATLASAVVHVGATWARLLAPPEIPAAAVHHGLVGLVIVAAGLRLWTRPPADVRRRDADDRAVLVAAAATLVAALLVALPALGSDLMSDGIESFEMGRSLATHAFPRSPGGTGLVGLGVGMISQAFPARWFDLAFPDQDVAPRLPFVLFLPLAFCGVVALVGARGAPRPRPLALAAIAATTLTFGVALGLDVGFDPYGPELASPGALDAATSALLLGAAWAATTADAPRGLLVFAGYAVLAHFARPSGLLLLLCLGASAVAFAPPGGRRGFLARLAVALVAAVACGLLYERGYAARAAAGGPALESASVVSRLRYLNVFDVGRLWFVVLPTGFFGVVALVATRRHDAVSRLLAVASVGTAAVFYVQAAYSPHHFVPAMTLPVAVLHRVLAARGAAPSRAAALVVLAGALGGLALAWPVGGPATVRPFRELGARIVFEGPDLREDLDGALAAAGALGTLVAPCHASVDPAKTLMGSTLSLARYARRDGPIDATTEFVVRPASAPPPEGFGRADVDPDPAAWAFYARTPEEVARARRPTVAPGYAPPLLAIDRRRLFRHLVVREKLYDLDLKAFLGADR